MLALFRTNQAYASLLLLGYALLLQLPLLITGRLPAGAGTPGGAGVLTTGLVDWLTNHPRWSAALAALCVGLTGLLVNVLAVRHDTSRKITQFPGLFLVLCWALLPAARGFHPLQPALIAVAFSLLALGRIYQRTEPAVPQFNAGLWLGVAALCYAPALALLPALFVGIAILRTPDPRSLLQVVTGVGLLGFLVGSWCYFRGAGGLFVQRQWAALGFFSPGAADPVNQLAVVGLGLVLLGVVLGSGAQRRPLNIEGSKVSGLLYWVLLFTPLPVLLGGAQGVAAAQLVCLPLGTLLGLWVAANSRSGGELLHLLLVSLGVAGSILALPAA